MVTKPPMATTELKEKEGQALCLLVLGYTAVENAALMKISSDYSYNLVRALKQRFHSKTIAGVVSRAIAEGVVTPDGVLITKPKP